MVTCPYGCLLPKNAKKIFSEEKISEEITGRLCLLVNLLICL